MYILCTLYMNIYTVYTYIHTNITTSKCKYNVYNKLYDKNKSTDFITTNVHPYTCINECAFIVYFLSICKNDQTLVQ